MWIGLKSLGSALILVTGFATAGLAKSGADRSNAPDIILKLKQEYIVCERLAQSDRLDGASIAACSLTYESLKHLAFNGNFQEIRAWYESQRALGRLEATEVGYSLLP